MQVPDWLYNMYIDCYNGSIALYSRFVSLWNHIAGVEPEENIIPTEMHNEQMDDYNHRHDDYNRK